MNIFKIAKYTRDGYRKGKRDSALTAMFFEEHGNSFPEEISGRFLASLGDDVRKHQLYEVQAYERASRKFRLGFVKKHPGAAPNWEQEAAREKSDLITPITISTIDGATPEGEKIILEVMVKGAPLLTADQIEAEAREHGHTPDDECLPIKALRLRRQRAIEAGEATE